MIAAGRTEEQQTAAEFAKVCPHDVVAAGDLMRLLVPPVTEDEREADRKSRVNAVAAVLRELGAQTYPRKVLIGGRSTRIWMLRNPEQWSRSTTAALREVVMRAQKDFIEGLWDLDRITQAWKAAAR
jgi:hypothetical protein